MITPRPEDMKLVITPRGQLALVYANVAYPAVFINGEFVTIKKI